MFSIKVTKEEIKKGGGKGQVESMSDDEAEDSDDESQEEEKQFKSGP